MEFKCLTRLVLVRLNKTKVNKVTLDCVKSSQIRVS